MWVDIAQSNPKGVYAQVEAKGAKGGLYRTADGGGSWTLVNSSQALRAREFEGYVVAAAVERAIRQARKEPKAFTQDLRP